MAVWEASFSYMAKTAANLRVNPRHVAAELVGMCLFIYIGTGTAVFFSNPSASDYADPANIVSKLQINASFGIITAFAFGIGILVSAFSIGHISGCHLNPAVTISLLASGNCGVGQAVANIIAQLAGSCVASLLLWGTSSMRSGGLGANGVQPGFSTGNAVLGEIVMTFFLCYVVHLTAIDKNSPSSTNGLAPIAIGFAVFLGNAVLIPLDGCSLNPARSFGPALVANQWKGFWIFVVGPIVGGLLAVPVFYFLSQHWEAKRDSKGDIIEESFGSMKITSDV